MLGGEIVGAGKSEVFAALDKADGAKLLPHHFPATIEGCVVNDENLEANVFRTGVDTVEALSHKVRGPPIDNDNRDIGTVGHGCVRMLRSQPVGLSPVVKDPGCSRMDATYAGRNFWCHSSNDISR